MVTAQQGEFAEVKNLLPDLIVPHVVYADSQTDSSAALQCREALHFCSPG